VTQTVGGQPASFSQIYVRMDATPALSRLTGDADGVLSLVEGGPDVLAQLAAAYDFWLSESRMTVEISLATEFEAELIDTPQHSPVFLLSSVDLDRNGVPVSFTRTVVRSDHFRFTVDIKYPAADDAGPDAQGVMSMLASKTATPTGQ
jgi:DNA-binding GntR family transcriptional regulator